jgi:hypothetical protein
LGKWDLTRLTDEACSDFYLNLIPVLRKINPPEYPAPKDGASADMDDFYGTCIKNSLRHFLYSWIFHNKRDRKFDSIEEMAEENDGRPQRLIADEKSLEPNNCYFDSEHSPYLWHELLPKMIGEMRAKLLYMRFVAEMNAPETARKIGRNVDWVIQTNEGSLAMIRIIAEAEETIRQELYDCVH